MPRISQEKFELLINNSKLSEEELKRLEILKGENDLISATLSPAEFKAYHKFCFKKNIKKSQQSREILIENLKEPKEVYEKKLNRIENRKIHTFLVPMEVKNQLRNLLKKNAEIEELTESMFVRRSIVLFLEKEGVKI